MKITRTNNSDTEVALHIAAEENFLQEAKAAVLKQMAGSLEKVPGFRKGQVPPEVAEKHINQQQLQQTFLDAALNQMYGRALDTEKLRPAAQPTVKVEKFVPFTTLEAIFTVEVVGKITMPDYKKLKYVPEKVTITEAQIKEVIENVRTRMSEKNEVKRAAKDGDEVWIDFFGKDAKGEPVQGADGKDYPLVIGSNTFIKGFEPEMVGLKAGEQKTFTVTFPKDYGAKALQNKKVTFDVTVNKVNEVAKPKVDDALAKKVGNFDNLAALKADIKTQLTAEQEKRVSEEAEAAMIRDLAAKTKVEIPKSMVAEQVAQMKAELKQNLAYHGQTIEEYLKTENKTEEDLDKELGPQAEERIRAGLALSEIADAEGLQVSADEVEVRINTLKGQYSDEKMQSELDKPEARREIASRLMTEKTIARLKEVAKG